MRRLNISLRWPAFEWQAEATGAFYRGRQEGVRFFVYLVSRQQGKTSLLEAITTNEALSGGTYGYFAPSYDRSEEVYNECCEALADFIDAGWVANKQTKAGWVIRYKKELCQAVAKSRHDPRWMDVRGGAQHFKSLGNPEHLRGGTYDGGVIDETGLVPGKVYRKILRPMFMAKDGWVVFSGTPPEDDESPDPAFFRGLYEYARDEDDPKWFLIHRDYTSHPSARFRADVEEERPRMPVEEFAREHLATFPNIEDYRLPPFRLWGPRSHAENPNCPKILPDDLTIRTGIDLADNENEIGDKASVVTYALGHGARVYILAAEYYRNPSEVLDALYLHQSMYRMERIWVQTSSFDKGFIHTVHAAAPSRGGLPIVPSNLGGSSKRRRIMQMEPIARAGNLFIHEDLIEFQREWNQFPDGLENKRVKRNRMAHHYDMLDAASAMVEDAQMFAKWEDKPEERGDTMNAAVKALKAKRRGKDPTRIFRMGGLG